MGRLVGLSTAESIAPAIAAAAQLHLGSSDDSTALLIRALAERDLLLVLDNCERLAGEISHIVQRLLDGTSRLRILATSQEALRCESEDRFRLDALVVPPEGCTLDRARSFSALQLLEQRARSADHHLQLSAGTAASACQLCRHLDGNALAIEMAAVRLPFLGADALLDRLVDRLRLLHSAGRGAPARQQSLRATLDWSHSLLSSDAQVVFRRLAAFVGSFRIDVAQWVAAVADLDEWAVLEALSELVDKSLLQLDQDDPTRYRLLESSRFYAAERLSAAGEAAATALRHAQAMQRLADEAVQAFWLQPEDTWLRQYKLDYADWQWACDLGYESRSPGIASATTEVLNRMDSLRSINTLARSRMDAAHALLDAAEPATQARLWDCVLSHRIVFCTAVPRLQAARQRVTAWRGLNEPTRMFLALLRLAVELAVAGDFAAAADTLAEARALEDPAWPARLRLEALTLMSPGATPPIMKCGLTPNFTLNQAGMLAVHRADATWQTRA